MYWPASSMNTGMVSAHKLHSHSLLADRSSSLQAGSLGGMQFASMALECKHLYANALLSTRVVCKCGASIPTRSWRQFRSQAHTVCLSHRPTVRLSSCIRACMSTYICMHIGFLNALVVNGSKLICGSLVDHAILEFGTDSGVALVPECLPIGTCSHMTGTGEWRFCDHRRIRDLCVQCGGIHLCQHGRLRVYCPDSPCSTDIYTHTTGTGTVTG